MLTLRGLIFAACLAAASHQLAAEETTGDVKEFTITHNLDGFSPNPDKLVAGFLPALVPLEDKIYLAFAAPPIDVAQALVVVADGKWRSDYTAESLTKLGTIAKKRPDSDPPRASNWFIHYDLSGRDPYLTFELRNADKGREWEWTPAADKGYFLKAKEGKFSGWYVDFEEPEKVVFTKSLPGGEVLKIPYSRWRAKLVKEPGKMSQLFLRFGKIHPVAR